MAAVLNIVGAKVVTDDGATYPSIQVLVRNNEATLRLAGEQIDHRAGVTKIARMVGNRLDIEFDTGAVWEVTRQKRRGCGCGK
jgi:hypothetical protein